MTRKEKLDQIEKAKKLNIEKIGEVIVISAKRVNDGRLDLLIHKSNQPRLETFDGIGLAKGKKIEVDNAWLTSLHGFKNEKVEIVK